MLKRRWWRRRQLEMEMEATEEPIFGCRLLVTVDEKMGIFRRVKK